MKVAPVVTGVVVWISLLGCWAQTNLTPSGFSLPPMQLRAELTLDSPAVSPTSPFPAHVLDTNSPSRDVSATTEDMAPELQSYNVRSDRFFLVPTVEPPPETPLGRALYSIAEPEVVHLGNKPLECSAVTAVKRKNPLCLLNATFLKMTW